MPRWEHKIRGLRQHLSDDSSTAGVTRAAEGIVSVLKSHGERWRENREKGLSGGFYEHNLDKFDEIVEELQDAGESGECDWFNAVLAGLYDWCDSNSVWIELDGDGWS
jgi:hypothetical protein